MPEVKLDTANAAELAEMLQFLTGWLARLSRVPWNFGGGPLIIRLPSDPHSGLRR
jgi:hypothetical protein